MRLHIRAHDLGVKGSAAILARLDEAGLDGVQMVCYKAYEDIPYAPGAITAERARQIGQAFRASGKEIPFIGAYFNPVHSNEEKRRRGFDVFADYLRVGGAMGCQTVGSETGSFNDDSWTYHPLNRTPDALRRVIGAFSGLCDIGAPCGMTVAMEGSSGHVIWNVETMREAINAIDRPNLKTIFDLYNYLDASNQTDYLNILDEGLEKLGGRICLFHIKDWNFSSGRNPVQTQLGEGSADLHAILSRIKQYDENATLVLEGTTGKWIEPAARLIRNIWEEI